MEEWGKWKEVDGGKWSEKESGPVKKRGRLVRERKEWMRCRVMEMDEEQMEGRKERKMRKRKKG